MIDLAVAEASVPCLIRSLHPLCAHLIVYNKLIFLLKKKKRINFELTNCPSL